MSMDQTEHSHYVSAVTLATAKRARLHVPKTSTAGTCIGPMPLPDWKSTSDTWNMSFKDKKAIYGDARLLPSGRPDGDSDLIGSGEKRVGHVRKDSDIEPLCYHGFHRNTIEELVHQVGSKGKIRCIVDLTGTDPTMALMAIEWNIPYLGITFGDFHLFSVKKQLANMVFQGFLKVKSPLHNAALASLMQGPSTTVPAKPIEDETAIPKKRARVGPKEDNDVRNALLGELGATNIPKVEGGEPLVGDD